MGRTIISRSDIQAALWEGAAQRAGLTLSAWVRATLDAEASSTSPSYVDAAVEHELEPVGRAVAADLTATLHADGSLPHGCEIVFETHPLIPERTFPGVVAAAVEREFRGPDPKPAGKPKKERRR